MTYTPRHRPYAHQVAALEKMRGKKAFALLMAMRTGKSKTLLDDFGELEATGACQDLLIIAPGGVYRTWETACKEHLSTDLAARAIVFVWRSGGGKTYKRDLEAFIKPALDSDATRPRIFLMNIEALSSVEEARDAAIEFLSKRQSMCAIDESTIIKGPSSKRTKFINTKLAPLATYRRILTGLPTPKSPMDLYSQFEFLDPAILGFRSFFSFRSRFAILKPMYFGGRTIQVEAGYRDLDELQARIAPFSHRVLLEDCYDLPPKIYMKREVSLTTEQKKHYKEMVDYATTQLASGDHVTATVVVAQIIRLHQMLCGHVVDEKGALHAIPENRTAALLEALEEYDGKAIIWVSYDESVKRVTEALTKEHGQASVARFWGGNRTTREEEEARFLNDPACRFMVSTPAAGGRGRTWPVADLVIYYSSTPDLEHRSQSEERPLGIGKIKSVAYIDLITSNTVEDKILNCLRNKINMASQINGENYREWLI